MTTYTKRGPFVDASPTGPYIDHTWFDGVEAALVQATSALVAPAPSGDTTGATDQAALQPLVSQAQTTGGKLTLQPGTYYVTGLATAQSFYQPAIIGAGKKYTTLVGVSGATAPTLRYKGGSGQESGGGVYDLTVQNPGGIGWQIADSGQNTSRNVAFAACSIGVEFLNESAGGFTEFNAIEAEFTSSCVQALHYTKTSGNESFHGSGLVGNSVIVQASTAAVPSIKTEAGCYPYNAPLSVTFFANSTQPLIAHNDSDTNRQATFYGAIRLESHVASPTLADPNGITVYFSGSINAFGNTGLSYGALVPVDRINTDNSGTTPLPRPAPFSTALGTGTTSVPYLRGNLPNGVGFLVSLRVTASNYYYDFLLYVLRDQTTGSVGYVTTLANPRSLNTAAYGAPTFACTNGQLTITNAAFPASGVFATGMFTRVGAAGAFI